MTLPERIYLIAIAGIFSLADWFRADSAHKQIQNETNGIRPVVIAVIAAAIEPGSFSMVTGHHAMRSLSDLYFDTLTAFRSARDLFCLDLNRYCDIESIGTTTTPIPIKRVLWMDELPYNEMR